MNPDGTNPVQLTTTASTTLSRRTRRTAPGSRSRAAPTATKRSTRWIRARRAGHEHHEHHIGHHRRAARLGLDPAVLHHLRLRLRPLRHPRPTTAPRARTAHVQPDRRLRDGPGDRLLHRAQRRAGCRRERCGSTGSHSCRAGSASFPSTPEPPARLARCGVHRRRAGQPTQGRARSNGASRRRWARSSWRSSRRAAASQLGKPPRRGRDRGRFLQGALGRVLARPGCRSWRCSSGSAAASPLGHGRRLDADRQRDRAPHKGLTFKAKNIPLGVIRVENIDATFVPALGTLGGGRRDRLPVVLPGQGERPLAHRRGPADRGDGRPPRHPHASLEHRLPPAARARSPLASRAQTTGDHDHRRPDSSAGSPLFQRTAAS